jgi:hypothetical protein
MPDKLHRLERLRLARDWSYQDLADNIYLATDVRRDQDCWRKICQGKTKNSHAPTLNAMSRFFAALNGRRRKAA